MRALGLFLRGGAIAVLAVLLTHGALAKAHSSSECPDTVVEAGHAFRRTRFLIELSKTTFFDRHEQAFVFDAPEVDGTLNLSIKHSRHGRIRDGSARNLFGREFFPGMVIRPNGDIDAVDAYVDYGKFKNEGYLSSLFSFFAERLPLGASFTIIDISSSKDIGERCGRLSVDQLKELSQTEGGSKLYAMYRRLRLALAPHEDLYMEWDDRAAPAFKNYLADVASQWGRVARHGNFRRDYVTRFATPYMPVFRKMPIPAAVRDEEDQLLKSLDVPVLLEPILPETRWDQVRRWKALQG